MKPLETTYPSSASDAIQDQKQIAVLLLNKLWFVDPNAILAGGAVRDWRYGNEANDLDFYLKSPNHKEGDIINLLQKLGCISITKLEKNTNKVYKELPYILSVWEAYYNDTRLNFVFLEDALKGKIPYFFSNSLCKCYMKYDGELRYLEEFERAFSTKRVKVKFGYSSNHPHIQKMIHKFPDYRFSYCVSFDPFDE